MTLATAEREQLITRYAEGAALLRAAWEKVPVDARKWRPAPGEWSAHEVVCHCADSETTAAARIRYLVAEKEPVIVGYDQDHWARALDYHAHPAEVALSTVAAVRADTAALLPRLSDAAWRREGRHTKSGRYTAEDWLRAYAGHLESHARQIEAALAAWRAAGAGRAGDRPPGV